MHSDTTQSVVGQAITIQAFAGGDEVRWDEYVARHPHGSPFHVTAWKKSIEESYPYRPMYLIAMEGDKVCGVLPLFLVENILVKRALISTPFAVYGGVLADSQAVREAMRGHLRELGKSLQVEYVELRNAYPEQYLGFASVSRYITFTQEIGPDEKGILEAIPRKTRAAVRKALKEEFSVRTQTSDFAAFEDLYSANLRRLGTPAFPREHFGRLLKNFGDKANIREIVLQGRVVAAVMSFYFRDQVLPYYGASDPAFNAAQPNNFMYYDLMRWGGQNGYKLFDFGRSKKEGSGSRDFKAHWGMLERELPYEILLVKRKQLPDLSPNNPRFNLAIKAWQHLPLAMTRRLGPYFNRLVP
jgi:FemAB-related protein (PEP-CTERM system-associated)